MKFFESKMRVIAPLVVLCCLVFFGNQVAQAQGVPQSLWLGNDTVGDVFKTTTTGSVITDLAGPLPTTGIAWDGHNLFFADPAGNFTKRTADGKTVLASFVIPASGTGEDLAWDSNRKVLWRILHSPPTLQKIDPSVPTLVASYPLPTMDGTLGTIGGLGVAYDSTRDKLYVSFCSVGCSNLTTGLVVIVDPNSPSSTVLSPLFRTTTTATGGLAYDATSDTLWVGDVGVVHNETLSGAVLSTFNRPSPGGFEDGLEITPRVVSEDASFTPSVLASGLSGPSNAVVFRPPTGDLVVSQFFGGETGEVSLVNATSGAISPFVSQSAPDEIAVRSSDGLVAVKSHPSGPITFYNSTGTSQGSIFQTFSGVITGVAFDASGNFYVANSPSTSWEIDKFPGPTPWTVTTPTTVVSGLNGLEGLIFSAAPLPSGSLYAISFAAGNVYQISLDCLDCGAHTIATVPSAANPSGIAIDPFSGDIFVSEFQGADILRIPPGGGTPSIFATGFSNPLTGSSLGLGFDTMGNFYANEYTAGNVWKFTRASNAAPKQDITPGSMQTFTNPNPEMADLQHTIMIPSTANLGGATKIQAIFVEVDPAKLNARLALGSSGDTGRFGGGPVAPGAKCVQVPSAHNNCLVTIQKCYDANGNAFDICPVQGNGTDLIQLTSSFTDPINPGPALFLIDFDTPPNLNTLTDITTTPLDCCSGSGGTKGLCSQTFFAVRGTDFSLSAPNSVTVGLDGSVLPTVTVNSFNGFNSPVALSVSGSPAGVTASLNPTSATPPASSTLTVSVEASVTPTKFTLTVTGDDTAMPSLVHSSSTNVTVMATTSGISAVIGDLLNAGCIAMDNDDRGDDSVRRGVANALTNKLSEAQEAINAGRIQTAINILTAFKKQVQAQSGKHIAASCTLGGVTFNPATVLLTDAQSLIDSLRTGLIADPITGYVLNSSGLGVSGATVSILDSLNNTVATAASDITGFYFFPTTGVLAIGHNYTVKVTVFPAGFTTSTPPTQTFTWTGTSGMVLNNFVLNP